MTYLETLDQIIAGQLDALAPETDKEGRFPRPVIDALAKAGLMGLVSSKDVGGMGLLRSRIAQPFLGAGQHRHQGRR